MPAGATGWLQNLTRVSPPAGVSDPTSANDFDFDLDALEPPLFCDDLESGNASGWSYVLP